VAVAQAYELLADVYEWLVPEHLLTPDGSAAAFAEVAGTLDAGARVLDCASGTGQLAVGLARRGFEVVASDASPAMVERTLALAERHGAELTAVTCRWEDLPAQGWQPFGAVFCVGNSLTHAAGTAARRVALRAMAGVLRDSGLLVVTSRNWERVRAAGSGLEVADRLIERDGVRALPICAWTIPGSWDAAHFLDVGVARVDSAGGVVTRSERLAFWPFRHQDLDDDLRAAGLEPASTTYAEDAGRYLVTARPARRRRSRPSPPGSRTRPARRPRPGTTPAGRR
jgi:SAM-dependent methyltransferase